MQFKLSYKIFVAFILTALLVVVLMVGLIRFYVARNFADYVNKSLLERYSDVAAALAAEYQIHRGWQALKDNPGRWQQILKSSLPSRDFDLHRASPQPPGVENKGSESRDRKLLSPRPSRRILRLTRRLVLFDADKQHIAGGILVLAAMVALLLSRHLLAPVLKLTAGTRTLASRRFDTRIAVESKDELGQLAADFNTMAQTLEDYERMRRQWISDIAHELRTPLSILRGEIEALKDGVRQVNRDTLDSLYSETRYLSKIVTDLHELSLADSGALSIQKVPVDPPAILNETLGRFKQRFTENRITIENNLENLTPISVIGDADRLKQLFSNLLENALRYAAVPGTLKIGQERSENRLVIFFEDSGPGVPAEALDRLFDRLYRVDRSRSRTHGGSGLGLSICKSIVTALGGEIRAVNGNSGGLRVEVELPLA